MTSLWLRVGAVTAAAGAAIFASGSSAWANSTIDINDGNVPTTAEDFKNQECSANQGGGPYADKDVWVFVLPGLYADGGDFVSVTLHLDTNGDDVADTTKTITADGGGFLNGGPQPSKAYIALPLGWQLIDATAEITGTADFFNLTHTCPADTSTTPPGTTPPGTTPPGSTDPGTTPPATTTTPGGGDLPTTGPALTGLVAAGVALVAGGSALLYLRRRRDAAAVVGGGDTSTGPTDPAL